MALVSHGTDDVPNHTVFLHKYRVLNVQKKIGECELKVTEIGKKIELRLPMEFYGTSLREIIRGQVLDSRILLGLLIRYKTIKHAIDDCRGLVRQATNMLDALVLMTNNNAAAGSINLMQIKLNRVKNNFVRVHQEFEANKQNFVSHIGPRRLVLLICCVVISVSVFLLIFSMFFSGGVNLIFCAMLYLVMTCRSLPQVSIIVKCLVFVQVASLWFSLFWNVPRLDMMLMQAMVNFIMELNVSVLDWMIMTIASPSSDILIIFMRSIFDVLFPFCVFYCTMLRHNVRYAFLFITMMLLTSHSNKTSMGIKNTLGLTYTILSLGCFRGTLDLKHLCAMASGAAAFYLATITFPNIVGLLCLVIYNVTILVLLVLEFFILINF